jgi:hypothetical protein
MENQCCVGEKGRYVYGIGPGGNEFSLGAIGIDGCEVYTIPCGDISAIVHSCSTEPYRCADDETVKGRVQAHHDVLNVAGQRLGVVIPLDFDTVLTSPDGDGSPDELVKGWLRRNYARLRDVMKKIEGKDEYAVQVSYEPGLVFRPKPEQSVEIGRITERIKQELSNEAPGIAYLYRKRLERAMAAETLRLADAWFKVVYARIKQHTDDILVEKTRNLDRIDLACLVAREKVDGLGRELEEINKKQGFSVRFSGPWPPYSFVARPAIAII